MKLKIIQTLKEFCENAIFLQEGLVLQQIFFNKQMVTMNNKNLLFFDLFERFTMNVQYYIIYNYKNNACMSM